MAGDGKTDRQTDRHTHTQTDTHTQTWRSSMFKFGKSLTTLQTKSANKTTLSHLRGWRQLPEKKEKQTTKAVVMSTSDRHPRTAVPLKSLIKK